MRLSFKETTFRGLFRIVGIKAIKNWSFAWSLILIGIFIFFLLKTNNFDRVTLLLDSLPSLLMGASASIFSIVLAALSITIALFNKTILPKLILTKLLHKFLFPFWNAMILWGSSIVLSLIIFILHTMKFLELLEVLIVIELFIFMYAVFYTIGLTGAIIRHFLTASQKPN